MVFFLIVPCIVLTVDHFFFTKKQFNRATKLRNLGQRPRNMLAKAGEGDRAIKTKMVSFLFFIAFFWFSHSLYNPLY